jgi:mycofactocin precursor
MDASTIDPAEATGRPEAPADAPAVAGAARADDLLVDELLVEEVSIDGMCGVY